MLKKFTIFNKAIDEIKDGKILISTINAHSYNLSQKDIVYQTALLKSDVLLPDGISIVWAYKWLTGSQLKKIAGADLFFYEMERLEVMGGKCFFLGSTTSTLQKIKERVKRDYPKVLFQSYSPPYKPEFNESDNKLMIEHINNFQPNVLFIGMTAPKQEKWAYQQFNNLNVEHICSIGAVFDFYAGNIQRAPLWMINIGLEWLYRLIKEPVRLWRRYLIGNAIFSWHILMEKINS